MRKNTKLWIVQGLLAALFLFAGAMKLVLPVEAMTGPVALPGAFLRFVGVCEVFGAIGLVLPWALGVRRELTPVAAAGLTIIMIGATIVTAIGGSLAPALVPVAVGALAVWIAVSRSSALAGYPAGHTVA
jgi:hypothetical protein